MEKEALQVANKLSRNETGRGCDENGLLGTGGHSQTGLVGRLGCRAQCPNPQTSPEPRRERNRGEASGAFGLTRSHKSGRVKKHEGLWSDLQKTFLASTGNKPGSLKSERQVTSPLTGAGLSSALRQ